MEMPWSPGRTGQSVTASRKGMAPAGVGGGKRGGSVCGPTLGRCSVSLVKSRKGRFFFARWMMASARRGLYVREV